MVRCPTLGPKALFIRGFRRTRVPFSGSPLKGILCGFYPLRRSTLKPIRPAGLLLNAKPQAMTRTRSPRKRRRVRLGKAEVLGGQLRV